MKSTFEAGAVPKSVNYTEINLLKSTIENEGVIVLTTGFHESGTFSGIVVYSETDKLPVGFFSSKWVKNTFIKVDDTDKIILQN